MALFGSSWLENHDSMKEYDMHISHRTYKEPEYRPIGAPSTYEKYDSMKEYEQKLH